MKVLLFFMGATISSFFGVIICRFPHQSIINPGSHCDNCHTPLKWFDLIPILSQVSTRFRCRYCHAKIPVWFSFYEFFGGALMLLWLFNILSLPQLIFYFLSSLLAIFDLRQRAYPILFWLILEGLLLCFFPLKPVGLVCLVLALLSSIFPLKIGAGDLLYLTSLSHLLNFNQLLVLIQFASLAGIIIALRYPKQEIPFIPFLFLAYIIIQVL